MNILERAETYLKLGWHPIYIPHKLKSPVEEGWQKADKPTMAQLAAIFQPPCNIGVRLGKDSGNLVDFDLDCKEAMLIAARLLPKTMTFGRKSKPRSHWIYYAIGTDQLKTHSDKGFVELRGDHCQTVFPGSMHPEGEDIEWAGDSRAPSNITWDEAIHYWRLIAGASRMARFWDKGRRDELFLALCGGLLRSKNWDVKKTEDFISLVCCGSSDEEENSRCAKVERTWDKIKNNEQVNGWPSLAGMIGDQAVRDIQKVLDINVKKKLNLEWKTLSDVVEKDPTFLWAPYLPEGELAMVSGDPGIGKGWLSIAIAYAVATGSGLPGQDRTPQGSVLIFSAEDSLAVTVKNRLKSFKGWEQAAPHIHAVEEVFALDETGLAAIEEGIEQFKAKLVIIDPFMSFTAATDMNQAHEVKQLLTPLGRIAQSHNCVILIINHLTKSVTTSAIYKSLGSVGILGSTRTTMLVANDPADPKRNVLCHAKANYSIKGDSLLYAVEYVSLTQGKFKWLGTTELDHHTMFTPPAKETVGNRAESHLFKYLEDGVTKSAKMTDVVAEAAREGISVSALRRAAKNIGVTARKEGFGKEGVWFWDWPEGGTNDF